MRSLKTLKTVCGLAAVALVLTACGGGSGSSSASAGGPPAATGGSGSGTTPAPTGTATLKWTAPTANSDGSALTDLAGYHIYYGTSSGSLSNVVNITSASTVTYVVTNLSTGTWYFAVAAYTSTGAESTMSNVGSKTIG